VVFSSAVKGDDPGERAVTVAWRQVPHPTEDFDAAFLAGAQHSRTARNTSSAMNVPPSVLSAET